MMVSEIRRLAENHSLEDLQKGADSFERERFNALNVKGSDEGDILSNYLAALYVKEHMAQGQSLTEAIRHYSSRVRSILS